jgi:trigger factor
MQVKELKNEKLEREYSVVVPANDIEAQMEEELQTIGKQVKIPGFRPGKVPAKVLKQRYGKNVMGEVLEKTVQNKTGELIKDKDERPAMQPKIEVLSFDEGKDLEFKVAYQVLPEVPEIDLSKISLEKLTYELPESEVKEGLDRLAGYRKSYDAKAKTAKAKDGDAVKIDFKGFVDGEAFAGGEAEGHTLELGSGQFIPGFEEQLVGTKAGDEVKVKVAFPKEYHSEELKGKDAVFEVKVHEVLEAKPVEINDEFAKEMGMENLEKLKEAISTQLSAEYDNVQRTKLKKALFDALDEKCKYDTPSSMVDAEFEVIWAQITQAKERGDSDPALDKPEKELREEYRAIAERRVRLGLFLADIGRKNDLEVTQEEISQAVMDHARQFPGQEQSVFEYYQKNPQNLEELRGPIIEEKSVDYILEQVKLKEKKVSIEELMADDEEESSKPAKKPAAKKKAAVKDDGKKATTSKKKPAAKKKSA